MEQKSFHENHFDSIQTLRAVAALFVILEHIRFLNCGAFGVDIFFCISGFMIMFSTHTGTKHFMKKRLIRILPLYYIMTVGTFLLLLLFPSMFKQTKANPVFLIKSLLFIPFDIGNGVLQPLMRIGWTINCELFFYLLFFLAFHISHKYRGLICSVFIGFLVAVNYLLPFDFAALEFYGHPVMLDFVLGIICYYVAKEIYHRFQTHPKLSHWQILSWTVLAMNICIFILLVLTKPSINILGFRRPLFWGIPAFLLVLGFFIAGLTLQMPRNLVRIGNISFSIYLIHYYPVMVLDRMIFDFSTKTLFAMIGTFISVVLCLGCAYVSWYLIENKLTKLLQKWFLK